LRARFGRANDPGMADYDLLLKGGIVIDGTRSQRYRADVAVRDGKIQRARGYRWVIVNGEVTIEDDRETHAHSGRLLRHARPR
jgi:N-acyl-D-aspartate/D-glutamate deacylase